MVDWLRSLVDNTRLLLKEEYRSESNQRYVQLISDMDGKSSYEDICAIKMGAILDHAISNVPFYKNLAELNKVHNEDFNSFPVISRHELSDRMGLFISTVFSSGSLHGSNHYVTSTSGSTGAQVVHIKCFDEDGIGEWVFWERIRRKYSLPEFREKIDLGLRMKNQPFIQGRVHPGCEIVWNMNSFSTRRKNSEIQYLAAISTANPDVIWGAPRKINELMGVTRKFDFCLKPKVIITSYEHLSQPLKNKLSEYFVCDVTTTYGTSESGTIAFQCGANNYHYYPDLFNLEILDEFDQPVGNGEIGRIVVTSLSSFCMPLIRYDTGDLGLKADKSQCVCESGLPFFSELVGRKQSLIKLENGVDCMPYALYNLVGKTGIVDFQFIQERPSELIVVHRNSDIIDDEFLNHLSCSTEKIFGERIGFISSASMDFIYTKNGKRNLFVQRLA